MKKNSLLPFLLLALVTTVVQAQMHSTYPGTMGPGQPGMGAPRPGQVPTDMGPDRPSPDKPPPVDDNTLTSQVHEQLATRPELSNVHIVVKRGVVDLSGTVPDKSDRKEARNIAESVRGVRRVKSHLTVQAAASTSSAAPIGSAGSPHPTKPSLGTHVC